MRRLLLIAAAAAALAGCGSSSTREVLRPTNPRWAGLSLEVSGPPGLTRIEGGYLRRGSAHLGQLVAADAARGQKDCAQTIGINGMRLLSGPLEKFVGKKYTISVYGDSGLAPAVCRALLQRGFAGGVIVDYRIPSSAMEPTLHCARPVPGCLGKADDLVGVQVDGASRLRRFDIVVFKAPREAALKCGEGGTFVKRVIGLPGDTVREDDHGFIWIRSAGTEKFLRLSEPYVSASRRLADSSHFGDVWHVPPGQYFVMGDNRAESCDSRVWGSVPSRGVLGPVVKVERDGRFMRPAEFRKQIEQRP